MTYTLGVDLGTTFTAAAVDDGSGPVPVTLGSNSDAMPSVVAIRDGEPVTGEAAEEILRTTPAAGVREAKRRLGDSTPLILDGAPYGAEAVMGLLLADVLRVVTEQRGAAPAGVVLSHPANWGDFKKDLLSDTARVAGLEDVGLITEPQAAAIHYVRSGELEIGQAAVVYDFGGGTFDAAVVRCAESGPELLGEAKGLERLGGIDLDQAILAHVNHALDGALRQLDPADRAAAAAMASVRSGCVAAKEALSTASEATIAVALPGLTTEVRLTRTEFEAMLRPRIADTLAQVDASVQSAGLSLKDLAAVVLVGGTSRIPLVGEMVAAHTGVRVVASADHKTVVCAGAAAGDAPAPMAPAEAVDGAGDEPAAAFVVTGPADDGQPAAGQYKGGVRKRRLALIGGAAALASGVTVAAAAAAGATPADALDAFDALGLGDDGDGSGPAGDGSTAIFGGMQAPSLDEFQDAPAAGGENGAGPAGGGPGGAPAAMGGSPMARAASMGHGRPASPARRPSAPDDDDGAPMGRPGGAPGAAGGDPEFMQTKSELLASIQKWQAPPGVDPKVADEFRAELLDRIQRFQTMPGESAEHALAAMRDEYQDQVKDFVQDQRIKDIIDDQAAEDAADAAVDTVLDGAKARLLAGLGQYKPPPGTDPEDFAAMRADVEALIRRYEPVPGQTAEEAMADLRFHYQNRVRDVAQEMRIDKVADELAEQDTAANATTTVTEGGTTITYGPAYYDRATNPPRPNVAENEDGTRTVSFVNEQGRHVTIKTTEDPNAAIEKYKDHTPPPEAPEHSPQTLFDRIRGDLVDRATDSLGMPRIEEIHKAAVEAVDSGASDPRVTTPPLPKPATDDVVGDEDGEPAGKVADDQKAWRDYRADDEPAAAKADANEDESEFSSAVVGGDDQSHDDAEDETFAGPDTDDDPFADREESTDGYERDSDRNLEDQMD